VVCHSTVCGGGGAGVNPMVTVAIPTYERATQLRRAIESVLAQDHEPIELIISDNASTDGTRQLCEDYVSRHPSIRYVRHSSNVGPTPNFESLRPLARGDYFMFLGDDDWIDPGYVSACVETLESEPGLSLVAGRSFYHRAGRADVEPVLVNIDDSDPRRRVLAYCRAVKANGVFYGVMPIAAQRRVPAMRNVQGGDWLHVMGLAYLGRVRTLEEVAVHRSADGMTVSLANVAAMLGLGWLEANAPQVAIANWIFRDVAFDSPLYEGLGRWGRFWLGIRAGSVVFWRFVPPAVLKFGRLRVAALGGRLRPRAAIAGSR